LASIAPGPSATITVSTFVRIGRHSASRRRCRWRPQLGSPSGSESYCAATCAAELSERLSGDAPTPRPCEEEGSLRACRGMYFDAQVAGDRTLVTSASLASRLCTRADVHIAKVDV